MKRITSARATVVAHGLDPFSGRGRMSHEQGCWVSRSNGHAPPESLRPVAYLSFVELVQPDEGTVSPVRNEEMQSVGEVSSFAVGTRWPTRRSSRVRAFLRWLRSVSHWRFESFDSTIGRAVEQAFAEFAKEMQR